LRNASDEFGGHCLALTLLGSYLTDAFNGDIGFRKQVSERLAHDVRQGIHARKVMESYQTWFGEGPELSILRMLGLFDRPADEKALESLRKSPAIHGLTESLTDLSPTEWRTILAKLRRARLLAGEDPHNPGCLDTHPLIREYFGEQLQLERSEAWRECNLRLYDYYRTLAPELPETFPEMESLFLAAICGCNAGLLREVLQKVYIPRIQRGNASFAASVLGARGALLSVLVHFFKHGRWDSPIQSGVEGQCLNAEDQLFILMQAGLYLTATRGLGAPDGSVCYARAERLCHALNRPLLLYVALMAQWRYSLNTDKLTAPMQIANRIYSLAEDQNDSVLLIGAYTALSMTRYFMGDWEAAHQYAMSGIEIWRNGIVKSPVEEVDVPVVSILCYEALAEWLLGEVTSCQSTMAEAIALAKSLNDMHGLAAALHYASVLGHFERNPFEVERLASNLIELSTRHHFAHWLALGVIFRGWALSASGDTAHGIAWIEDGIRDYRSTGARIALPFLLTLKAEALHLGDRTSEAFEALKEAESMAEMSGDRGWCAEICRFRGLFLAAVDADETQLRLPSPQPSARQRSRSQFLWHNEPRQVTQNIAAKNEPAERGRVQAISRCLVNAKRVPNHTQGCVRSPITYIT